MRRTPRTFTSLLLTLMALFAADGGCLMSDLNLDNRMCPCAEGWTCDEVTTMCVRTTRVLDADAGAGGGADSSSAGSMENDPATLPDASATDGAAPGGWHPDASTPDAGGFVNGSDGDVIIDQATNLALHNTGSRSCADGGDMVFYTVTSRVADNTVALDRDPAAGCLAPGDEVLVIRLLSTDTLASDAGSYDLLRVRAVRDGQVSFDRALTHQQSGSASPPGNWDVLQRVPNYRTFALHAGATLTVMPADIASRSATGMFVMRGELVTLAGALIARGAGLPGGAENLIASMAGEDGIAPAGPATGGGRGGLGDSLVCVDRGSGGGGGGHATQGAHASADCGGTGGAPYGDSLFERLFLGAGGGAGGTDDNLLTNPPGGAGGAGGGLVAISAQSLTVSGSIDASGAQGQGDLVELYNSCTTVDACWDYAGPGGGGAGGSIWLSAESLSVGTGKVVARGGKGGLGVADRAGHGGDGSPGRILLHHGGILRGTTLPPAQVTAFDCQSVQRAGLATDASMYLLDPDGMGGVPASLTQCSTTLP